jgi:hypothetical protein
VVSQFPFHLFFLVTGPDNPQLKLISTVSERRPKKKYILIKVSPIWITVVSVRIHTILTRIFFIYRSVHKPQYKLIQKPKAIIVVSFLTCRLYCIRKKEKRSPLKRLKRDIFGLFSGINSIWAPLSRLKRSRLYRIRKDIWRSTRCRRQRWCSMNVVRDSAKLASTSSGTVLSRY